MKQAEYLRLRIFELESEIKRLRNYTLNTDFQLRAMILEGVRDDLRQKVWEVVGE